MGLDYDINVQGINKLTEGNCKMGMHLDKDPLHSTSFYICGTTLYDPWYQHLHPHLCSFHSPFTSSQYLLPSEPSHPKATSSAYSQSYHLSHLYIKRGSGLILWFLSSWRQGVECGGKLDNGDSRWRQGATWRQ